MAEERLQACAYRILRYTPNLVRDEWVNIGILLLDPINGRLKARVIEEESEFARVRRLHPNADVNILRALKDDFAVQMAEHEGSAAGYVAKLDETLSNVLQLSPQCGILLEDFDAELDRLYCDHVAPPRYLGRAAEPGNTRVWLRPRVNDVFRSAGIFDRLKKNFRVDDFTFRGDPFHLDYAFQRNGTQGFIHTLALSRDPAHAKVLAFTAERIRAKIAQVEFSAITEAEPTPGNERHQFIAAVLRAQAISVVPLLRLPEFASRLRAELQ